VADVADVAAMTVDEIEAPVPSHRDVAR